MAKEDHDLDHTFDFRSGRHMDEFDRALLDHCISKEVRDIARRALSSVGLAVVPVEPNKEMMDAFWSESSLAPWKQVNAAII